MLNLTAGTDASQKPGTVSSNENAISTSSKSMFKK
jgi:hypothetical protein